MLPAMDIVAHLLAPSGDIPNHPRWPLLIYNGAVALSGPDPAANFEALFNRNRWPAAWRNGVHPFHHYHSNGHEALGVYSGEVTVQFGGEGGVMITAKAGDVIVLPAGIGHKKLSSKGTLGVVGSYPEGTYPETSRKAFSQKTLSTILAVPLPACDPVLGAGGPLFKHWQPA
jgi:uncharacterized protein YjlB